MAKKKIERDPKRIMAENGYTLLEYLQMPVTWIVVLLVIIIVQLVYKRRCINVHVGGPGMASHSYRDILSKGSILNA